MRIDDLLTGRFVTRVSNFSSIPRVVSAPAAPHHFGLPRTPLSLSVFFSRGGAVRVYTAPELSPAALGLHLHIRASRRTAAAADAAQPAASCCFGLLAGSLGRLLPESTLSRAFRAVGRLSLSL